MKLSQISKRQWILGGALVATLAATLWAAQQDDAGEAAVQATAGKSRSATPAARVATAAATDATDAVPGVVDWHTVQRADWPKPGGAQLAAWMPPAPPPLPPAPPPPPPAPPMAPPFPYQLIGRLVDGDAVQALLAGPNRSLSAKVGDLIDNQWKVEQIGPTGMTLVWQPAKLTQMIAFKATP